MAREGAATSDIASSLGVLARTVCDWRGGRLPRAIDPLRCERCGSRRHPVLLECRDEYACLLGLYLGDGCISAHGRGVFRLRIILDVAYPGIIEGACTAMSAVIGRGAVQRRPEGCVEVHSYSRSWPCLFPQHGPGKKHERPIVLAEWRQTLVAGAAQPLLRGLIHSDGCRAVNTGRGGWTHPRYTFSNRSDDIHVIFRAACDRLGVRFTTAPRTTYVSRVADVARLDEFIGPKR